MQTLPFQPTDSIQIGASNIFLTQHDGGTSFFANLEPIGLCRKDDQLGKTLWIARLSTIPTIKLEDLQEAFNVSESTVNRAVAKFKQGGEKAFREPRLGRGTCVIVGDLKTRAESLLAKGMSGVAVATELGVPVSTLTHNIRKGYLHKPHTKPKPRPALKTERVETAPLALTNSTTAEVTEAARPMVADPVDRSERDQRDRAAPMGRGTRNCHGRVAASLGRLPEMPPRFDEPLTGVANGGVLAALPALLQAGLLHQTSKYLSLPNGFYGMTSILLFLAFMLMARVRNPEALRHQTPGEWGAALGLDRCSEAKTLRNKVKLLARNVVSVRHWHMALAKRWMEDMPETATVLSVDGHVKVYTGRKGKLPKHFVSRQKLCLPASTGYWVNALGGQPLLCLNKDLDPKMTQALEQDILPTLEAMGLPGADAPDLTAGEAVAPALTLVFDREGWSAALFKRLARKGIAVITWHKGFKGEPWPVADFSAVEVPMYGPSAGWKNTVRLAEKVITLTNGLAVRQIRRLMDDGKQQPLVTTDRLTSKEQLAGALFSRWSQENFFKYAKEEFNLDALSVYGVTELDPEAEIVNPAWRDSEKQLRRLRAKLGMLRNKRDNHLKGTPSKSSAEAAEKVAEQIKAMEAECEELKRQRGEVPKKITVAELSEEEKLEALPSSEKLLMDTIRMIAYRAETRMMNAVASAQGKKSRARGPLAGLFKSAADIIPEPENGILRVRILGTASDAADASLERLLDELNQTKTVYPETRLRMVYELPGNGQKST